MKKFIILSLLIVIISLGWFIPIMADDYTRKLKADCLDQWIQFTYIDLQTRTLSEVGKIGFANYWFETCFDLDFDMTSGDFMDRVYSYLEENDPTNEIIQKMRIKIE